MKIADKHIGPGNPVYIIAELSANHQQDYETALQLVKVAAETGADAVKLQTYTPDTLTIDCDNEHFQIGKGTPWEGKTLYELYGEAYTPWEWQPKLKEEAEMLGIHCFSSPFDRTAVDFLEDMKMPAYKIASFELVDIPLIKYAASTGKPIIMSTGMASEEEIGDAVEAVISTGNTDIALLKCTSAYPALPEDMNLNTIPDLASRFNVISGLSDHTLSTDIAVASVALGASIIEKHIALSRDEGGPDASFSLEPDEFRKMVDSVRTIEKSLGKIKYSITENEKASRMFRRSLFAVEDIKAGEKITSENIDSIRPGAGLSPKFYDDIINKTVKSDIKKGTPLSWDLINR